TLARGTDGRLPGDLPHCYSCALAAWDQGEMDGFLQGDHAPWAYTQLHKDQLPNYWHWARQNVLFDNFFASAQGPSFPNHLYSIAATSGGAHDNPRAAPAAAPHAPPRRPPPPPPGPPPSGPPPPPLQTVEVYDSEGRMKKVPPC